MALCLGWVQLMTQLDIFRRLIVLGFQLFQVHEGHGLCGVCTLGPPKAAAPEHRKYLPLPPTVSNATAMLARGPR